MKLSIVLLVALCVLALVYQTSAKKRAGPKRYKRSAGSDTDSNTNEEATEVDGDDGSNCKCPCEKPSRPAGLMCFEIADTKFFGGAGKPYKKPRKPCTQKDEEEEGTESDETESDETESEETESESGSDSSMSG